jgi:hypothetical protein
LRSTCDDGDAATGDDAGESGENAVSHVHAYSFVAMVDALSVG